MVFLSHTAEPRGSRDLRDRKRELKPSRTHGRTWRAWATVGTNLRSSLAARDGPFCRRRACAHLRLTRPVVGPRRTPRPLGPRAGGSDPRPSASRRQGRVAASSFLSPRESSAPRVLTQAAGSCRASGPMRDTQLAPPFLRGARAASSLPGASSPRVVLDAHAERHPSVRHRLGVKPTPRPPADLQPAAFTRNSARCHPQREELAARRPFQKIRSVSHTSGLSVQPGSLRHCHFV